MKLPGNGACDYASTGVPPISVEVYSLVHWIMNTSISIRMICSEHLNLRPWPIQTIFFHTKVFEMHVNIANKASDKYYRYTLFKDNSFCGLPCRSSCPLPRRKRDEERNHLRLGHDSHLEQSTAEIFVSKHRCRQRIRDKINSNVPFKCTHRF